MDNAVVFWGILFPVWAMTMLQAAIALSARTQWWKDKGYWMCRYCGKWRPNDEMAFRQKCWRCAAGES